MGLLLVAWIGVHGGAVAAQDSGPIRITADIWLPLPGPGVGNAVRELDDGGLVVAGYVRAGSGDSGVDGVVAVLEPDLEVRWLRRCGGEGDQFLWDVREEPSRGLVVTGFTGPADAEDVWMMRLDPTGEVEWERTWGDRWRDRAWSLDHDGEGGWYLAAERQLEGETWRRGSYGSTGVATRSGRVPWVGHGTSGCTPSEGCPRAAPW